MSTTTTTSNLEEWARQFYIHLDTKDFCQLAEQYLTEDVVLSLGDLPQARGHAEFVSTISLVATVMKSMRHHATNVVAVGNLVMAAVDVTYKLGDFEETRTMRAFGVFTFAANKVSKYEIYADFTPVNQVIANTEMK